MRLPRLTDRSLPLPILWVCLLSFGLAIPFLSLYADDWPFLYVNHLAGFSGVVDFIKITRPFGAWIYAGETTLFGDHIWLYHASLLALRAADALLVLWLLRLLWPRHPRPALFAALFFAVYPAFKQQVLSVEYNLHFLILGLLLLSFITMIKALQGTRLDRRLGLLSWVLSFNVFFIEYFTGQELLRPLLLWIVLARQEASLRHKIGRLFALWSPYLLVDLLFLIWRVFILKFPSYQPELVNQVSSFGLAAGASLLKRIPGDLWTVTFGAWLQVFSLPHRLSTLLLVLAGVLACLALVFVYLLLYHPAAEELSSSSKDPTNLQVGLIYLGLGLLSLFFAGWPFWITNIEISLDFSWNRGTLPFIIGASLFTAGLVQLLSVPRIYSYVTARRIQAAVMAILTSFSCGMFIQTANLFRNETAIFTPFFWELAWRMPGLTPGTALLLDENPFNYHVDKFYSPLVNWTLAADNIRLATPYTIIDLYKGWGTLFPPAANNTPINRYYNTLTFHGSVDRLVLLHYQPPGCLRLLTPALRGQIALSSQTKAMLKYSRPDLVLANPPAPSSPPAILGGEPAHTWCYYFEKADLAAQQGNWLAVAFLGDQAAAQHLAPGERSEWLVFIEGYARQDSWDKALALSHTLLQEKDSRLISSLCQLFQSLGADQQLAAQAKSQSMKTFTELGCTE